MHLLAYVMRPNKRLCTKVFEVSAGSFSKSDTFNTSSSKWEHYSTKSWFSADVSVHLRAGDKHELDSALLSKFTNAFENMFRPPRKSVPQPFGGSVLFSSDDLQAITMFRRHFGSCTCCAIFVVVGTHLLAGMPPGLCP